MQASDFTYQKDTNDYVAIVGGIKVCIPESNMDDAAVDRAAQIVAAYPAKLADIAQFCFTSETFQFCYPGVSPRQIAEKLHAPMLRIDNQGGMLSYTGHTLDEDHIIDVEFSGILEAFWDVSIDG